LKLSRSRSLVTIGTAVAGVIVSLALAATPGAVPQAGTYTFVINTPGARRTVPFRSSGNTDLLPLDQLASIFNLTVTEDAATGGLVVDAGGQRIVLTVGQSLASVSGRIVSMSGAVVRDGRAWFVPVDFLSRAVGPAMNTAIDVRRTSHLVVVGDVRLPQVIVQFDRQGPIGRLQIETRPATPVRATRDGARLTLRFDADALDANTIAGAPPEFIAGSRVDGATILVDLGPAAVSYRVVDDRDPAHTTIELLTSAAPPTPPQPTQTATPPPIVDMTPAGAVRTVIIDAGHGGADAGAHGPAGTIEKDLTLQMARRLKAAVEARIGLRVLLTRDADVDMPMDRRTAFANNSKADLFISLHANASVRPSARGAQVLSMNTDDYKERAKQGAAGTPVPVIGGGTRMIEAVPWDVGQLPHAAASSTFGSIVIERFTAENVPLFLRPVDLSPLRVLAGANMPAVLIELGFLTNPDDERALGGDTLTTAIVNALVASIQSVRSGIPGGRGSTPRP